MALDPALRGGRRDRCCRALFRRGPDVSRGRPRVRRLARQAGGARARPDPASRGRAARAHPRGAARGGSQPSTRVRDVARVGDLDLRDRRLALRAGEGGTRRERVRGLRARRRRPVPAAPRLVRRRRRRGVDGQPHPVAAFPRRGAPSDREPLARGRGRLGDVRLVRRAPNARLARGGRRAARRRRPADRHARLVVLAGHVPGGERKAAPRDDGAAGHPAAGPRSAAGERAASATGRPDRRGAHTDAVRRGRPDERRGDAG